MYEVKAIIRPERLSDVVHALHQIPDVPGVTVSVVRGFGKRAPHESSQEVEYGETEMAKVETVVPEALPTCVDADLSATSAGRTAIFTA